MTALIVLEDEPVLREELEEFLAELGYQPTCAASIAEFDARFDPERHLLAVIDIGLPDGDGLALVQRLRRLGQRLGIVVFSARNTGSDRVCGLDFGADHYLGKECDLDELAAVLASLSRRLGLLQWQPPVWRLELGPRLLHVPDALPVSLSHQDLRVLQCLMSRPGESVSHRAITLALGMDFLSYDRRRLDSQMYRIRRRVAGISGRSLPVKTMRNAGYCFYQPAHVQA